jgi:hypothetical protein
LTSALPAKSMSGFLIGALLGRVAGTLVFRPLDRDGRVISAHSRVKQSDRLVRANRPTRPS